jgi:nuclear transport factor 2 (NTF2) superfamily protein
VKNGYTTDSIWRNRDTFLRGHDEIVQFLTKKWSVEDGYRLRKELFAFTDNKVSHVLHSSGPWIRAAPAALEKGWGIEGVQVDSG